MTDQRDEFEIFSRELVKQFDEENPRKLTSELEQMLPPYIERLLRQLSEKNDEYFRCILKERDTEIKRARIAEEKINEKDEEIRRLKDELNKTRIFYCENDPCNNVSEVHLCTDCHEEIIESLQAKLKSQEELLGKLENGLRKVADGYWHDEKTCTHQHCEYNCHAKGWNEAIEHWSKFANQILADY